MSCNNVNVEPTVIGGGNGSNAYDAFGRLRVSNPFTIFAIIVFHLVEHLI